MATRAEIEAIVPAGESHGIGVGGSVGIGARESDTVTIDDSEAVFLTQNWWSGQGDPLYAIGSSGGEDIPREIVEHAVSNLHGDLSRVKPLGDDKFQLGKGTFSGEDIEELQTMLNAFEAALSEGAEEHGIGVKVGVHAREMKLGIAGKADLQAGEDRLSYAHRQNLPGSRFALPERRALPIENAAHVRAASARLSMMRNEGHVTPEEYRKAHARIAAAGRRFGVEVAEAAEESGLVWRQKPDGTWRADGNGGHYGIAPANGGFRTWWHPRGGSPEWLNGNRVSTTLAEAYGIARRHNPSTGRLAAEGAEEASGGFADIRVGDRVTILVPGGRGRNGIEWVERSGRVVMRGPHGWALDMGGPHGRPGVATPENFVRVKHSGGASEESADDPEYKERWIEEIAGMLRSAGYVNPEEHARRLVAEGYGPGEIAHRIQTGQLQSNLGIQMIKHGDFKFDEAHECAEAAETGSVPLAEYSRALNAAQQAAHDVDEYSYRLHFVEKRDPQGTYVFRAVRSAPGHNLGDTPVRVEDMTIIVHGYETYVKRGNRTLAVYPYGMDTEVEANEAGECAGENCDHSHPPTVETLPCSPGGHPIRYGAREDASQHPLHWSERSKGHHWEGRSRFLDVDVYHRDGKYDVNVTDGVHTVKAKKNSLIEAKAFAQRFNHRNAFANEAGEARLSRTEVDETALNELDLYLNNTSELYRQKVSILQNIEKRIKKGTYDPALAQKLWLYWVDAGAQRYAKEFATKSEWSKMFPKALREKLAAEIATREYAELMIQQGHGGLNDAPGGGHVGIFDNQAEAERGVKRRECSGASEEAKRHPGRRSSPIARRADPPQTKRVKYLGFIVRTYRSAEDGKTFSFDVLGPSGSEYASGGSFKTRAHALAAAKKATRDLGSQEALEAREAREAGGGSKRVGVAFTKPHGPSNRRDEYGVYSDYSGGVEPRYVRYEGYREDTPQGEKQVGLPLSGPHAAWAQPLTDFKREHFEVVRIFDAGEVAEAGRSGEHRFWVKLVGFQKPIPIWAKKEPYRPLEAAQRKAGATAVAYRTTVERVMTEETFAKDFPEDYAKQARGTSGVAEAAEAVVVEPGQVLAYYNGAVVDMKYVPAGRQRFNLAAMRIVDNGAEGYVLEGGKKGDKLFFVGKGSRTSKVVTDAATRERVFGEIAALRSTGEAREDFAVSTRDQQAVDAGGKIGPLTNPRAIYDFTAPMLAKFSQEVMLVIPMDLHGVPLNDKPYMIGMGQRDRVSGEPADILRPVIETNAAAYVLIHCHPSRKANPSEADKRLTDTVRKAGAAACPSSAFLDHVIIGSANGRGEFYSFTDKKLTKV